MVKKSFVLNKKKLFASTLALALCSSMIGPANISIAAEETTTESNETMQQTEIAEAQKKNPLSPHEFIQAMLDGKDEKTYTQFSDTVKQWLPLEVWSGMLFYLNHGVEDYHLRKTTTLDGTTTYVWSDDAESRVLHTHFDDEQKLTTNFYILSGQQFSDTDQQRTTTSFSLPLSEEWYVLHGGTNAIDNKHYGVSNLNRYAYDFTIVKEHQTYEGDAQKNESYYAYGEEVIAPAAGTVVVVENSIVDNVPGEINNTQILGNHVVIDHGNNEYSYYLHLKQGSLAVNVGDQVSVGDLLGQVGNSGQSMAPHLHFQVSDDADIYEGKSIRLNWNDFDELVGGQFVKKPTSENPCNHEQDMQ
ncbi:M23 family metallopeptidase [Longirhabdus pacifica]|uniref:M23 family metallopeptidase n=1 Tax=Longirhabdus pacifica TaxID=2305227 RepID=UPI0010093ACF|nr:M23 family metallopeptidase [Longirhabdus pacifica]